MYHKCVSVLLTFIFILSSSNLIVQAEADITILQNEDIHILLIYSTAENEQTENVSKLDLLLHHFTENISIMSDANVSESDIHTTTHIVYYGEHKKELREDTRQFIDNFSGPIVAIGENIEQLTALQSFQLQDYVQVNEISFLEDEDKRSVTGTTMAYRLTAPNELETLLFAHANGLPFPVMTKKEDTYYLSVIDLDDLILHYFAEVLHDIFPNNHPKQHKAYIRLESIHPASDPEKVLEVAEKLIARKIPFSLAITPVYTNPETNEQTYFKDAEELLEVLHYLQRVNGTFITHGYTNDQTQGYEFWDVELDQAMPEMGVIDGKRERLPTQEDFPNRAAYESFLKPEKTEEASYVNGRVEKAIYELVEEDIHPLAFTAPLDAMSNQGYEIVSNYYTAMFGSIQLSDETFRSKYTPPFVTTGSFLNGVTLYPETIGDVTEFDVNGRAHINKRLEEALIVRDSVIGVSYQTYLGAEYLDDFIKKIEQISHMNWLDLQETEQLVTAKKIKVESSMSEVVVTNELTFFDELIEMGQQLTFFEKVLWGITFLVFLFVMMFLLFALHLRLQLKKRLFRERK